MLYDFYLFYKNYKIILNMILLNYYLHNFNLLDEINYNYYLFNYINEK